MPTLLDYLRVSWILNLSPSLQHSLLKKWKQLPFFHKVAKKGKSSIFGQERFPLCECFSDYRNFASMLVITVHGRGWDKVVFEDGWVEGFLIEEILLPPTLRDLQISVFQWVAFQET